jgi:hypothetical protein
MTKLQKLVIAVQTWALTLDAKSNNTLHMAPVAVSMALTCEETLIPDDIIQATQDLIAYVYREKIGKVDAPRPSWMREPDDPGSVVH